ncbi:MAG: tryptophan synthase subunit alpha [Bacteroidota bacterium]
MIGFGISDKTGFDRVCSHASGAIIGSAFIRHLAKAPEKAAEQARSFVKMIREGN